MKYLSYNAAGVITGTVDKMAEGETLPPGNWVLVEDDVDPRSVYIRDQELWIYPEKPGDWAVFDIPSQTWIDPRTPEDLEAELNERRMKASLSRIEFLLAAKNAGLITPQDAEAAAELQIPPSLQALIGNMTEDDQFEARIRWKGATVIERLNPLINLWAGMMGVTQEQLDVVFGCA